jgi:hypothetical protein
MALGRKTGGRDFAKGQGGRPRGTLNTITVEVRDLARSIVEDPSYLEKLKQRIIAGKAPHMEQLLFHYAFGKPKEHIEVSNSEAIVQALREGRARAMAGLRAIRGE